MRLEIGEKYLITSDPRNIIVSERYEKKQKDETAAPEYAFKEIAYCANLEQACKKVLQKSINLADAENLADLVRIIHEAKNNIVQALMAVSPAPACKCGCALEPELDEESL